MIAHYHNREVAIGASDIQQDGVHLFLTHAEAEKWSDEKLKSLIRKCPTCHGHGWVKTDESDEHTK